jgi:cytochrome c peroxidase
MKLRARAFTLLEVVVALAILGVSLVAVLDIKIAGGRLVATGADAGDGRANPWKSPLAGPLALSATDKADLLAFLRTLTDSTFLTNPAFSNPFAAQP